MSLTKGKQINKLLAGYIRANTIGVVGTSSDITIDLTSVLATAGYNNSSVPLTPSTGNQNGIAVTAPTNRVEIFDAVSKEKIINAGEEVYGRITEAAGVYTLSFYFKDNSGVETVHNFGAVTSIDIEFVYRFKFGQLPTDAFTGLTTRNVVMDAGGSGDGTLYKEPITITGLNTVANLTYLPTSSTEVILYINSKPEFANGATPSISVAGTTVTWNSATAGYDIDPSDVAIAEYKTLQI